MTEVGRQLGRHSADADAMLAALDEERDHDRLSTDMHRTVSDLIRGAVEHSPERPDGAEDAGVDVDFDVGANDDAPAPGEATQFLPDADATVVVGIDVSPDSTHTTVIQPGPATLALPPAADRGTVGMAPGGASRSMGPVPVGTMLKHRFKLVASVGRGGMGRVYKAVDLRRVEARSQDVHVAVKLLTAHFKDYSGSLAVLQREATKLQRLSHPNIVRVIDCDRDGQTVFMTMEYLPGVPLKRFLEAPHGESLSREERLEVIARIGDALEFAHRNDIVHGDLKPSNVIVTDDRETKVIDFGIARMVANARQKPNTRPIETEALMGFTPTYASPEMFEEAPADPRDDVYAFACLTHEILTGTHPFERVPARNAREAGLELKRNPALTGTQFRAIRNGLQFDRAQRTPSIDRFMREFRGERAASMRRVAAYAGLAALVVLAGVWALNRSGLLRPHATSVGDVFRDCEACPLMKVLPPGRFEQGSRDTEPDAEAFEKPHRTVRIAHAVAFGVQEVTRAQFKEFVDTTKRKVTGCATYDGDWITDPSLSWEHAGFPQTPAHPAACVSWQDATAYAAWLSQTTGHVYRLPSASEWEYAARAGRGESRPWGARTAEACVAANIADESAAQRFPGWKVHDCNDGYVFTAPVGAFGANAFGLSDLFGNVFEWTQDCWHEGYAGAPTDGSAWTEGDCSQREMRGGSWFTTPAYVRAAYRNHFDASYRSNSVGFRLVRELER
jgi:formylglycine-generating enzyme required for sulfatase activity